MVDPMAEARSRTGIHVPMPDSKPKKNAPPSRGSFITQTIVFLALFAACMAGGCRSAIDKRTFQYLNSSGFGKSTTGDANIANYVTRGDIVTIRDTLHPDLELPPQEVDVDGTISLPDVGQVKVDGKTREDIKVTITELYATLYDETDIQVTIAAGTASTSGKKFFVVGEAAKIGAVNFRGDFTVFEAVLEAKPKNETANLGRVQLIRGDPVDPLIVTVNIHDFIDYGDTTYNLIVRENDIIYIPPTLIGSIGNFVERIFYPVKVIVQPLQSLLFFFAIQGNPNNRVF